MRFILLLLLAGGITLSHAQDIAFARRIVDTLASDNFWGRGYTKDGLNKTAEFLKREFVSYGLSPLNSSSYFQEFSFPVNTFPGNMRVSVNGIALEPGRDFIVHPRSRGIKESCRLVKTGSTHFQNDKNRILVSLEDKLTWSVSQFQENYTSILINKKSLKQTPQTIRVNIENKHLHNFKTLNVCGIIKGSASPDSLIVITAHYDHLGGMGKDIYFPGANDNASGVALLLNIAKYYSLHPPRYSVAFICFSGEEAGLLGSKYFTENPLIDLKKIKFLINTDLAGTGEEGITVVNASIYKKEFQLLKDLNQAGNHLVKINPRGKAANSDHYWFTEKGVPSFFIYTMGGIKAYHDIYDRASTLPLTEFEDLFRLITKFNKALME